MESAERYERDAPVWVYAGGAWRHGRVVEAADTSVLVCYYAPGSHDIAVEAVTPPCVMHRKPSG